MRSQKSSSSGHEQQKKGFPFSFFEAFGPHRGGGTFLGCTQNFRGREKEGGINQRILGQALPIKRWGSAHLRGGSEEDGLIK